MILSREAAGIFGKMTKARDLPTAIGALDSIVELTRVGNRVR
jgi:hypothetical protein